MKKSKKVFGISIFIVLIIGIILSGIFFITKEQTIPGIEIISRPVFGYLSCSPDINPVKSTNIFTLNKEGENILCSKFHPDASSCQVTINVQRQALNTDAKAIKYSVCNVDGSNCITNTREVLSNIRDSAYTKTFSTITNKQKIFVRFEDFKSSFSCLVIDRFKDECWQSWDGNQPTYSAIFTPYVLWRNDIFGGSNFPISESCSNPKNEALLEKVDLLLSTSLSSQFTQTSSKAKLNPEERWSYIGGFVLSPYEIELFNNQQAYCSNKVMYGFDKITTISGKQYLIADVNKRLGNVACCNGDTRLNEVCQNHQWISLEKQECSIINPCKLVDWVTDPTDSSSQTIQRQECVSNKCVLIKKDVECSSSNACNADETCVDFVCKKTGGVIGDEGEGGDITLPGFSNLCKPTLALGNIVVLPAFSGEIPAKKIPLLNIDIPFTRKNCFGFIEGSSLTVALLGLLLIPTFMHLMFRKKKISGGLGVGLGVLIGIIYYLFVINFFVIGLVVGIVILIGFGIVNNLLRKVGLR